MIANPHGTKNAIRKFRRFFYVRSVGAINCALVSSVALKGVHMNTITGNTVIGVFSSQSQAQAAVNELRGLGFTEANIGVASKHSEVGGARTVTDTDENSTEGATAGAAVGLGAGALWGLGILAGVLPAIGPVIAGGTLAAIAASAATGAAAGGLGGALIGLGVSETDVKYYDSEFSQGRVIVTVDAGSRAGEAEQVMLSHGGHNRPNSR